MSILCALLFILLVASSHAEYSKCEMSTAQSCSLSELNKSGERNVLIFPGGETRCIYSTSTPYAFQVFPGSKEKLLIYFQGGGLCWDEKSNEMGLCTSDAVAQSEIGIFERSDMHCGNVTRDYEDSSGLPIKQVGLINVKSVISWIDQQVNEGSLSDNLEDLVIMGCSAGSHATQVWSSYLLQRYKHQNAATIADSYAGIFPPTHTISTILHDMNFCSSDALIGFDDLIVKCDNKVLEVTDINLAYMEKHSKVPFSFIQSKTDEVQMTFFTYIGMSFNSSEQFISHSKYYQLVNDQFAGYHSQRENFVVYLIDGVDHCFTNQEYYYNTTPVGKDGTATDDSALFSWINPLPLNAGESISTVCEGRLLASRNISNTYCSDRVFPHTFVQP